VRELEGRSYQARFDALASKGMDVHGEAALVRSLHPATVLDAGCGTGRVAIELARHDVEVLGVDVDASMLAEARRRAPTLHWLHADLATLALDRTFDVVVMAGNVPLFCPEEHRADLVVACAGHTGPSGLLVCGFELGRGYGLDEYDAACDAAGLQVAHRWSTWDREPFGIASGYVVSVHAR
jgi:SAM-dependent methyltransferase